MEEVGGAMVGEEPQAEYRGQAARKSGFSAIAAWWKEWEGNISLHTYGADVDGGVLLDNLKDRVTSSKRCCRRSLHLGACQGCSLSIKLGLPVKKHPLSGVG